MQLKHHNCSRRQFAWRTWPLQEHGIKSQCRLLQEHQDGEHQLQEHRTIECLMACSTRSNTGVVLCILWVANCKAMKQQCCNVQCCATVAIGCLMPSVTGQDTHRAIHGTTIPLVCSKHRTKTDCHAFMSKFNALKERFQKQNSTSARAQTAEQLHNRLY